MTENHIEDKKEYSVDEVAQIMGVTYQTVSKYLRTKELKGKKKGPRNKWYVTGSEIKLLLKKWDMLN